METGRLTTVPERDGGAARYRDRLSACLAGLGLLSPCFLGLVAAAGLVAPGYSPVSDEVSDLALGAAAPLLDGGLAGFGALLCLFAVGLGRSFRADADGRRGALALGLVGVAVACLAVFPTDRSVRHQTLHGVLHGALFLVSVVAFVAAEWRFARAFGRDPRWRAFGRYTRLNAVAVAFVWLVWVTSASQQPFDLHPPLGALAGVIERALILAMCAWIGAVAARHTQLSLLARGASASGTRLRRIRSPGARSSPSHRPGRA
jgi:hypothetical membrane protein